MIKKFSLVAVSALLTAFNANAGSSWYVGFDVHQSKLDLDSNIDSAATVSSGVKKLDDTGAGVSIFLGRQINSWLALEFSGSSDHVDLLDYENYYNSGSSYEYALYRANIYSFGVSSKVSYNTAFQLSLYAKPGLGYTITDLELNGGASDPNYKVDIDEKNTTLHFNFEIGAEYFLTDSFSASVAYERRFDAVDVPNVDEMSQDLIKGGIRYHF